MYLEFIWIQQTVEVVRSLAELKIAHDLWRSMKTHNSKVVIITWNYLYKALKKRQRSCKWNLFAVNFSSVSSMYYNWLAIEWSLIAIFRYVLPYTLIGLIVMSYSRGFLSQTGSHWWRNLFAGHTGHCRTRRVQVEKW